MEDLGNAPLALIRKNARCEKCLQKQASLTLIAKTPGYTGGDRDFSNLD